MEKRCELFLDVLIFNDFANYFGIADIFPVYILKPVRQQPFAFHKRVEKAAIENVKNKKWLVFQFWSVG